MSTRRGDPAGTKYDPEFKRAVRPPSDPGELRPSDLRHGLDALRTQAAVGKPGAVAVLAELDRLRSMLALIPRGAKSKAGTHEWTGRRWREARTAGSATGRRSPRPSPNDR